MLTLELLAKKNISLIELCVFDKFSLDMGIRGGLGISLQWCKPNSFNAFMIIPIISGE